MRRDIPEPLIALLCFVLGIWLWDHYFGKDAGYAPGTEEMLYNASITLPEWTIYHAPL